MRLREAFNLIYWQTRMAPRKAIWQAGKAFKIVSALGPLWVFQRLEMLAESRLGLLERRAPAFAWEDRPLGYYLEGNVPADPEEYSRWRAQNAPDFFFSPEQLPAVFDAQLVVRQAGTCLEGSLPWFSRFMDLGFPPDWHRDPVRDVTWPREVHWSKIDEFATGDVKLVWEASRFSFLFLLARAYAATRDEKFAEAFWELVEDWVRSNPPNLGINWKCGQEASFRAMAWCFGLWAFAEARATSPDRVAQLAAYLGVHAERIAAHIDQAVTQRNNHGLSEAVGLFTIASLFPEFKQSASWKQRARALVEQQVPDQFYGDGSYIQHSFNYERLALHDLLWAMRLAEIHGELFSESCYQAVGRAAQFLAKFCDPESGRLPNYGHNDGALLLPLATAEYGDYRPTIQAASLLSAGRRWIDDPGPWDELSHWLGLTEDRPQRSLPEVSSETGYIRMTCGESWAMLRAATYKDRPGQADQLHFDLWWRGENIACDPGTLSYNPGDSHFSLAGSRVHNTVALLGHEQMTRASRFLWLDWAQAHAEPRVLRSETLGEIPLLTARHDGYRRLGVTHRRTVFAIASHEAWLIVDDVLGYGPNLARLQWLFSDYQYSFAAEGDLELRTKSGQYYMRVRSSQAEADLKGAPLMTVFQRPTTGSYIISSQDLGRGSISLNYMQERNGISFESLALTPARFVTVLSPQPNALRKDQAFVVPIGDVNLTLGLSPDSRSVVIESSKRRETLEWA